MLSVLLLLVSWLLRMLARLLTGANDVARLQEIDNGLVNDKFGCFVAPCKLIRTMSLQTVGLIC